MNELNNDYAEALVELKLALHDFQNAGGSSFRVVAAVQHFIHAICNQRDASRDAKGAATVTDKLIPSIGARVYYHPIIGEPHTGIAYTVRAVDPSLYGGVCWLRGKSGFVSCEAISAVPSTSATKEQQP